MERECTELQINIKLSTEIPHQSDKKVIRDKVFGRRKSLAKYIYLNGS